jgi:hypothetical protein
VTVRGIRGWKRGKGKTLSSKEAASTLYTYIRRQHNETHQTLFQRGVEEEVGTWDSNGEGEFIQSTLCAYMDLIQ